MTSSTIAKSAASKGKTGDRPDYEKMFYKMEKQKKPVLPENFSVLMEERLRNDFTRRACIVFLEKPFKEMTDTIRNDRNAAVALADLSRRLPETIERYKSLVEFLQTAQVRINMALCVREDMTAIFKEVRHG